MNDKVHVVMVADKAYEKGLEVAKASMIESCSDPDRIEFHILREDVRSSVRSRCRSTCAGGLCGCASRFLASIPANGSTAGLPGAGSCVG